MKKNLLIVSALLLLLTALLCGCQKQEDSAASVIYWNVDGGSQRTANADGSYDVTFLSNAESVTLQVPTQEMMSYIDKERAIGLTVAGALVFIPAPNASVVIKAMLFIVGYALFCKADKLNKAR